MKPTRGVDLPGISLARPTPLAELVGLHGGIADRGAERIVLVRVAPITTAGEGDLAPLLSRKYLDIALESRAALLVSAELADALPEGRRWVHEHASYALAGLLETVDDRPRSDAREAAHIEEGALVADDARIGPGAVVLAGAVIGEGCRVEPNAVIYGRVVLGARVSVGAGAVIGRPGFGWAFGPQGALRRMPQLGGVVVEDDVEIGPLATIDSGTLAPTRLGMGARIDAHVHIAHNVNVGKGTIVAAQSGFAGSVEIGPSVAIGGQVGIADHVVVGEGARIAAKSGVIGDIPRGATVAGYPAVDRLRWLRGMARLLRRG